MFRFAVIPLVLALVALPVRAHDDRTRAVVGAGLGAAVGAAIGSELGGRNEAILGGAIGGAAGAAIATEGHRDRHHHYERARRYHDVDYRRGGYREHGHRHQHKRRGPSHCPPGLAMQGRC